MNPQALMKQYKEILKTQEIIYNTIFEASNALVRVKVNGKKEVISIEIEKNENLDVDDLEALEDMILLAVNDAMKKVDSETEKKMGKYTNMLPGLF